MNYDVKIRIVCNKSKAKKIYICNETKAKAVIQIKHYHIC